MPNEQSVYFLMSKLRRNCTVQRVLEAVEENTVKRSVSTLIWAIEIRESSVVSNIAVYVSKTHKGQSYKTFTDVIYGFCNKHQCLSTRVKHPLGAPFYGRPLALPANIRLGWKGLPGTNT